MKLAITRQVSRAIVRCELTYVAREPIDIDRARQQHAEYERALHDLGLAVLSLPEEPELPDSVFVEDTALILDEVAILLRPGAASRRAEMESVAEVLGRFREVKRIRPPACIDGGDILRMGHRVLVGRSGRTDAGGIDQLRELLTPFGYNVEEVDFSGCLHLKSAATEVAPDTILVNPAWVNPATFRGVKSIAVDPSEPHGANALLVGEILLFPSAFPLTRTRLEHEGMRLRLIEADELGKAEGGLTCCSLILDPALPR